MNLRLYALVASISLSGCVLTDPSNETGGDFLESHGVAVLPSDARGFALKTLSVESVPVEGVFGSHGTEVAALGALGRDSLRLVLGFDLSDTTARNANQMRQKDSLTRLRFKTLDRMPAMNVRARFVIVSDARLLPGLLAGLEPAALQGHGLPSDSVVDTALSLPALDSAGDTANLALPGAIAAKARILLSRTSGQAWLVVLLDSRTGSDQRVRFQGLAWMDRPSKSSTDTSGTLGLGTYEGYRTWRTVGFQPSGALRSVGWWPAGGRRLRVRLDAAALRSQMSSSFGIAVDSAGGYDNTFNVLQARIAAPFASVAADAGPGSVSISSVAIADSFDNRIKPVEVPNYDWKPGKIELTEAQRRICGLTVDPELVFRALPGGLQMELKIDNEQAVLPTQHSLARGSTNEATLERSFLLVGDSVEFRLFGLVRVRVKAASPSRAEIRTWFLEQAPLGQSQRQTSATTRAEAQLAIGGNTKLVQEVRGPLTQLLNRTASPVEFDLAPIATSDPSSRFVAIPSDPAKIFDSVKVVVRPLLSRNN